MTVVAAGATRGFQDGTSKAEMRKKRTKHPNKGDWREKKKHCNLLVTQYERGRGRRTLMSLMTILLDLLKRVLFLGKMFSNSRILSFSQLRHIVGK